MQTRQQIGIILMIIGFVTSFFNSVGLLVIIAGIIAYGENRLALLLLLGGLFGMFSPSGFAGGLLVAAIGAVLLLKNIYFPSGIALTKNAKRKINPFSGKKHYDRVDDDKFLQQSYQQYYAIINQSQLLDNTQQGQLMISVTQKLISAVENYLQSINRSDYTQNYYDWDVHLIANNQVNAFCKPGGKMVVFSGLFSAVQEEEDIAFILGHEMAHALLDHSRTRVSAQKTKNRLKTGAKIGSLALSLAGYGAAANVTRAATSIADVGSHYFLMKPWGRDQEYEADKLGMMIIHWAGYDISKVPGFWARMTGGATGKSDFFSTHPADSKRLKEMQKMVSKIENTDDFTAKPVMKIGE